MSEDVQSIATRFVNLVIEKKVLALKQELPVEDRQILLAVVCAAGFEAREVVFGPIVAPEFMATESGPIHTGRGIPVNGNFPYKVINLMQEDHPFATGWLSCSVKRVVYGPKARNETLEMLVDLMVHEISRSQPLDPIRLNSYGDFLCEYQPSIYPHPHSPSHFVRHKRDGDETGYGKIGYHKVCNGWFVRHRGDAERDSIQCEGCNLVVIIPVEAQSYGDIRADRAEMIVRFAA